jgi:hypothetical protein
MKTIKTALALAIGLVLLAVLFASIGNSPARAEARAAMGAHLIRTTTVEEENARSDGLGRIIERADAPRDFAWATDRSLTLDSSGRPHIAYGGDNLYHAWYDGSAWHSEVVDEDWEATVGFYAAIALDSADRPHISYYDSTNMDLRYARWTGSAWDVQTVDGDRRVGQFTSLALDENDYPHISYRNATSNTLEYARWTGSAWAIETVDSGFPFDTNMARHTSLALEATDPYTPHISYCDIGRLKHAWRSSTTWMSETVESGSVCYYTSLALDGDGHPRIGYLRIDIGIRYAWYNGTMWTVQTVDNAGSNGGHTSLALESTAPYTPHISYYEDTSDALMYAWYSDTIWITQEIANGRNCSTSLALDENEHPHISYYDSQNNTLKHTHWTGDAWAMQTVDSFGRTGQQTSLFLDSFDRPHIVYYDEANRSLKYARWAGNSWISQTVDDSSEAVGKCASLVVDGDGYPHISYYDVFSHTIKHARWTGSVWAIGSVDGGGSAAGGCTSLALASTSPYTPHISYYADNDNLRYACWTGSAWMTQTVDGNGKTGEYNSLALDENGFPHISYYDRTNDELKYAWYDGTSWISETVECDLGLNIPDGGFGGYYTSLALDGEGGPHISYYKPLSSNGELLYAQHSGTVWITNTVDGGLGSGYGEGGYASLALASTDPYTPYISYYDYAHGSLKYASYNSGAWMTETLDSTGDVGAYTALALDSFGRPHISYYDATNTDLKYTGWPIAHLFLPLMLRGGQ